MKVTKKKKKVLQQKTDGGNCTTETCKKLGQSGKKEWAKRG